MASAAVASPDQSAQAAQGVNPWLIAASVMLATFMEVLDTAIASVALPYIAGSLSASTDEATWVLTSLPRRQRHHPAGQQLVLAPIRTQTLPHDLRRHLHRLQLRLRSRPLPRLPAACPCRSGCRRRSAPANLAGHPARIIPTRQARCCHGRLRLRSRRRPRAGPNSRRMAHGHLFLALRLLHQHPHRHYSRCS